MFKLLVLSALVAISSAKALNSPMEISPIIGKLISEKTLESHGSTVVHSTAPLVQAEPVVAVPVAAAAVPVAESLLKTESVSSDQAESQPAPNLSNEAESKSSQESQSPQPTAKAVAIQANQLLEITPIALKAAEATIESHGHSVIHHPSAISYVAPVAPIVQPIAPIALTKASLVQPIIQAPILKAAPLPYTLPIYYSYPAAPAALVSEKTISSYGHTIVHHN